MVCISFGTLTWVGHHYRSIQAPYNGSAKPRTNNGEGSFIVQSTHAVRARDWYREFREITLMCVVYNIKRAVKQ